jgi:hypothetical protein
MATTTGRTSARKTTSSTARKTATQTRKQTNSASKSVQHHGRRVATAARTEARAVAVQPVRPAYFAVGVADSVVHSVKTAPSQVVSLPRRGRDLVVAASKRVGDVSEAAQSRYTDMAVRGQRVVASIRRLESTQEAEKYASRASHRLSMAGRDAEVALDASARAATESVSKLG